MSRQGSSPNPLVSQTLDDDESSKATVSAIDSAVGPSVTAAPLRSGPGKGKFTASVRPGRQSRMMAQPMDPSTSELQDLVSGIKDYLVVQEAKEPRSKAALKESDDDDDDEVSSSSGSSAATSADAPEIQEPEDVVSVLNVEPETLRPRFVKNPASNLDKTDYFFALHSQKVYFKGYVYKKNEYGTDGKPLTKENNIGAWGVIDPCGEWLKWWAELIGPVLYLWRVPDSIASMAYEPAPTLNTMLALELDPSPHIIQSIKASQERPLMMNLLDATSELFSHEFRPSSGAPPPPVPYTSFFGLSTVGSNLFLFASPSYIASNAWVGAVRLSVYESAHINTVFSLNLLRIPPYMVAWSDLGVPPFYSAWHKGEVKFSGIFSVRHSYQAAWRQCFGVISQVKYFEKVDNELPPPSNSSVPSKENKRISNFFGGSKKKKDSDFEKKEVERVEKVKGQLLFFESKAEYKKGSAPFMIVEDATSAYAMWPETLDAAKTDRVTFVRVRGKVILSGKTSDPFTKSKKGADLPQSVLGAFRVKPMSNSFSSGELQEHDKGSKPAPSQILLQCANTHESLHWLVGILGAFHIDADIDVCDVHSALWLDPPPGWGELCLTTDEIAGFSTLVSPTQTLLDFSRLLRDKKSLLKAGLFSNWVASVQQGVEQRKKYELREVEVKARELIAWVEKIKTGPVKLPAWVQNELSITFDGFGDAEHTEQVDDSSEAKEEPGEVHSSEVRTSNVDTLNSSEQDTRELAIDSSPKPESTSSLQSKDQPDVTDMNSSVSSPTTSASKGSEGDSELKTEGAVSSSKSPNSGNKEVKEKKQDSDSSCSDESSSKSKSSSTLKKPSVAASASHHESFKQISHEGSALSSSAISPPKTKDETVKKIVLDLTLTAPSDLKPNTTESSTWYKEEQERLKSREQWLAGLDIGPVTTGQFDEEGVKYRRSSCVLDSLELEGDDENGQVYNELEDENELEETTIRKPFQLFASNSLLEKVANQPTQKEVTDGPLLGEVKPEAHKPKLEGGLLGQMDRREKEFENIRRMGGYRATMMPVDYTYGGMPIGGYGAYPGYPPVIPGYPPPQMYGNPMYGGYPGQMPYMPQQPGYPPQQGYFQEESYDNPRMLEMREKWLQAEREKDGISTVDNRASRMPLAVDPSVVMDQASVRDGDASSESSESNDGIKRASSSPTVSSSSDASDDSDASQKEGLVTGKKSNPIPASKKGFFTRADESSASEKEGGSDSEEEDLIPLQHQSSHQNSNRTPSSTHSSGHDSSRQYPPSIVGGYGLRPPFPPASPQMGYQGYYPPQPIHQQGGFYQQPGYFPPQGPYGYGPYGHPHPQRPPYPSQGGRQNAPSINQGFQGSSNHTTSSSSHRQSQFITASQRQSGIAGTPSHPPGSRGGGARKPVANPAPDSGTESEESADSSDDEASKKKKKKALLASRMKPGKKR